MRAKAKKAPMTLCSVSLIAIELKGLAAPGEALKNYWMRMGVCDWSEIGALEPFGRMRNANWVILRF